MRTLLQHTGIYLLARGLPGVINFLAIAVYTRLLPPDEYGRYALVMAGVGFAGVLLFYWLGSAVLRFTPAYRHQPEELLGTVRSLYLMLLAGTLVVGLAAVALFVPAEWRSFVLVALLLLWAQGWFEINLEKARAELQPARYGISAGLRSIVAICTGVALIFYGLGAIAPLLGHIAGFALGAALLTSRQWHRVRYAFSRPVARQILLYGLPLTGTFALSYVINSSDRFLIAHFLGEEAAGVYAAGYDAVSQVLFVLMMIVNMAAYPLAVANLEQNGTEAAKVQLSRNVLLLLSVAIPACVMIVLFAPQFASVMLGQRFRQPAVTIIPYIALATLLAGIRAYHFDLAFQLGKYTIAQIWVTGSAAIVNVLLNLVWIPRWGILGAAWATIAAYVVALLLSILLGRRVFPVPVNWKGVAQVFIATLGMCGVWYLMPSVEGVWAIASRAGVLLAAYCGLLAALHAPALRRRFRSRWLCIPASHSQVTGEQRRW